MRFGQRGSPAVGAHGLLMSATIASLPLPLRYRRNQGNVKGGCYTNGFVAAILFERFRREITFTVFEPDVYRAIVVVGLFTNTGAF